MESEEVMPWMVVVGFISMCFLVFLAAIRYPIVTMLALGAAIVVYLYPVFIASQIIPAFIAAWNSIPFEAMWNVAKNTLNL